VERSHAERIVSQRRREMWIRARGVLRSLLGSYLGIDPTTASFTIGEHGRPALATDPPSDTPALPADAGSEHDATRLPPRNHPQLDFNLSHSRALALYAFTYEGPVGVDIEVSRRPSDDRSVGVADAGAGRPFDEPARRPVDELAIAARAFGRERARRLAGLEPGVREREFLRAWVRHEAALKCLGTGIGACGGGPSREDLWVAELDLSPGASAAVALEQPPVELRCWDWVGSDHRV
jgi:4'-phosphopantetheinyl transferase